MRIAERDQGEPAPLVDRSRAGRPVPGKIAGTEQLAGSCRVAEREVPAAMLASAP